MKKEFSKFEIYENHFTFKKISETLMWRYILTKKHYYKILNSLPFLIIIFFVDERKLPTNIIFISINNQH